MTLDLDRLYATVYEQSLDAPFREQVDLCTVLGELRRLSEIEDARARMEQRADVEALVPALVARAKALGIEVDEQEA